MSEIQPLVYLALLVSAAAEKGFVLAGADNVAHDRVALGDEAVGGLHDGDLAHGVHLQEFIRLHLGPLDDLLLHGHSGEERGHQDLVDVPMAEGGVYLERHLWAWFVD